MVNFVGAIDIAHFVGPYYGWGGTNVKCDVRVSTNTTTQEVSACAMNGAHPTATVGERYVYRIGIVGGTDLPATRLDCQGTIYGGAAGTCYTASMIDIACTLITPASVPCSAVQGSM